jgi:dihydroxy-acid dehydratase
VFVYGGTIMPGIWHGQPVDIVSVFEAVGKHAAGKMSDADLADLEQHACPGSGSCGGMYTANTMASAIEALGLSLPNSSAQAAISNDKQADAERAGTAVVDLLGRNRCPRDIHAAQRTPSPRSRAGRVDRAAHLLAIAHTAGVKLTIDDFTRIGRRVPVLADLKPSGKYGMAELVRIGGLTPLLRRLLDRGLLHGDAMTVTGRTLAENLAGVADYPPGQQWQTRHADREGQPPRDSRGNLAPGAA